MNRTEWMESKRQEIQTGLLKDAVENKILIPNEGIKVTIEFTYKPEQPVQAAFKTNFWSRAIKTTEMITKAELEIVLQAAKKDPEIQMALMLKDAGGGPITSEVFTEKGIMEPEAVANSINRSLKRPVETYLRILRQVRPSGPFRVYKVTIQSN